MIKIKKLEISSFDKKIIDVSFDINKSCAIIGESGSGKSLTLKAILGLLPSNLTFNKVIESSFEINNDTVGFIPQNPFTSLSPMTKIKNQFFCSLEKTEKSLKLLNLDLSVLNKFPSQLSGGQIQRIVVAMALCKNTKLLLLDEPTTALDFTNKNNMINIIRNLQEKLNLLILFVTHEIELIKEICENVIILRNGKIIEEGLTKKVLNAPQNDYTKKLIESTFVGKKFRI